MSNGIFHSIFYISFKSSSLSVLWGCFLWPPGRSENFSWHFWLQWACRGRGQQSFKSPDRQAADPNWSVQTKDTPSCLPHTPLGQNWSFLRLTVVVFLRSRFLEGEEASLTEPGKHGTVYIIPRWASIGLSCRQQVARAGRLRESPVSSSEVSSGCRAQDLRRVQVALSGGGILLSGTPCVKVACFKGPSQKGLKWVQGPVSARSSLSEPQCGDSWMSVTLRGFFPREESLARLNGKRTERKEG